MNYFKLTVIGLLIALFACNHPKKKSKEVKSRSDSLTDVRAKATLITLDPGHFHAALVQKTMYDQISPLVYIYAPEGPDVTDHLNRIQSFNSRKENPTVWKTKVYTGDDFLQKMIKEKPGNLVIISGNNRKKTELIKAAVDAGLHVLADKPMAIDSKNFDLLKKTFKTAEKKQVLLYDIMTERYEITSILQKELSLIPEIFGKLVKGSLEKPAIVKESIHHFFKYVAGNKIKRPAWFFDVKQEGEGLVDVTTHLIDLIQWTCFPEQAIDYTKDIKMLTAKRWATKLNLKQFSAVTGLTEFPDYVKNDVKNNLLYVFCNGEMNYTIKGIHAKVSVSWNYRAPKDSGDTHFSIMRGSKANLVIKQGKEQDYKTTLYIEPVDHKTIREFETSLKKNFSVINKKFPGVSLKKNKTNWELVIPNKYKTGHEAHFSRVMEKFLHYLTDKKLPKWEVANMIAKYYTTTKALELALKN